MSELRFAFDMAVCIKNGAVGDHEFRQGEIYPILGYNNGVQIGYTTNGEWSGDMKCLMCHQYRFLAPVEGEQFADQDGTIPPLFNIYSLPPVPKRWGM